MLVLSLIYTLYKQQSRKSYERSHRGITPTILSSGAKSRTPRDWKSLLSNEKNKTHHINLILDQWTTDKYAT